MIKNWQKSYKQTSLKPKMGKCNSNNDNWTILANGAAISQKVATQPKYIHDTMNWHSDQDVVQSGVSDQIWLKPANRVTEDGLTLEISEISRGGIVLRV